MRAAIFDLDGTIIDLFDVHLHAFQETVRKYSGLAFTREDLIAGYGRKTEEIAEIFFAKYGVSGVDLSALAMERRDMVLRNLSKLKVLPGVVRLLGELRASRIKCAVGTSARRDVTVRVLKESGLSKYFDALASIDDVSRGKPAPDIFLYAAKKLGVPPTECVVFEDAPFGIQAAKAAGMKTVAVAGTSCHRREELEKEKPDLVAESLKDVDAAKLKNLF